jgi:hypothetical protein
MDNNNCCHRQKISKMVVVNEWDVLSDEFRHIIANDPLHLHEVTKWFIAYCENQTDFLFNNPDFDYNNSFFFGHKRRGLKHRK